METPKDRHIEQLKRKAVEQRRAETPPPVRRAPAPAPRKIKPLPRPQPKPQPKPRREPKPTSQETYFWYALPLFFCAIFLLISALSYLAFWQEDQNLASWNYLFDNVQQDARNWGGRVGAIFSEDIIGKLFGLSGLVLPFIISVVALKILHIEKLKLNRTIRSLTGLMIFGSLAFGHFAGVDANIFGTGLGGEMGIYAAQWLQAIIGFEGTTLLIVVFGLAILYFANINWIKRALAAYSRFNVARREYFEARREAQIAKNRLAAAESMQRAIELERANAANRIAAPTPPQPKMEDVVEPEKEQPADPEPVKVEEPEVERDENIIELDNGTLGYIVGATEDGEAVYYYLDVELLPIAEQQIEPQIEMPKIAEIEEERSEEVEFIIKTHPQEEDEPRVEAVAATIAPNDTPQAEGPTTKVVHFAPAPGDPNFIIEQTISEELVDDHVINLSEVYDPTLELRNYQKPPVELLKDHTKKVTVTNEELVENKNRIVDTLANFGIEIKSIEATTGPTVTLYEIIPAPGVRISKIKNLEEDIALSLAALGIRIIAPIPGKGTIGIEVPNKNKEVVSMYSVIKSSRFQDSTYDLPIALGKNIQNETVVMDLAKMPHLLVAGATGQGKSVGLNAIITSLLYKKHPAELKFILVDPKKVELTLYAKLEKHFLAKMPDEDKAIITDTQKVIHTLNSVCIEMSDRYDLLEAAKVRNFKEYNEKFTSRRLNPEKGHRYLPYFVVIIDEFADLIMTAGREVETPIARIAQLARAVGIHLIIATQRPSVNIITGVIRANFPARMAFRVATATDSRTILDTGGANQLVGQGDMLISNNNEIIRVQCAFIDTPEVDMITEHISSQKGYPAAYELPEYVPEGEANTLSSEDMGKRDSLFEEVARYVVSNQSGSASTIQRKFSIGFNRAGRIVDQLEAAGIVGKSDGSKARQVLISDMVTLDIILG